MSNVDISPDPDHFRHIKAINETIRLANDNKPSLRLGGPKDPSKFYRFSKICLDMSIAAFGLAVLFPMIVVMVLLLYVMQGRPIFIAHERLGRGGATFKCLKFRTMVVDAESKLAHYLMAKPDQKAEWEATRKLKDDPRITPFGAILRKSSIDEVPQLLNILQGHMSLVGPRPITASESEIYGARFADYAAVRPGLTGLWQVSGRNDTTYAERIQLDVRYVRERSIALDLWILVKTFPAVMRLRGSY